MLEDGDDGFGNLGDDDDLGSEDVPDNDWAPGVWVDVDRNTFDSDVD